MLEKKGQVDARDLPDVLEPDVLTTGEVNLMVEPIEAPEKNWSWVARTGSIAAHVLVLIFILLSSKLFPYQPPTTQQSDLARKQLSFIYMPPDVRGLPRTPPAPNPQIRVDPRILRRIVPPGAVQSLPVPKAPERVQRDAPVEAPPELPPAPAVQVQPSDKPADFLRGAAVTKPQAQPSNVAPNNGGLVLPRSSSPGRALEESAQEAMRGGGATQGFGGPGGGAGGGGGGGGDGLGGAVQMLTPTEGVDFTNYLARVVASVKRNWYSIMPESARLGDKGRVMLQFRIMRNGSVPDPEPQLVGTSGKDPLDRASMSSIRASSPFEPLPPAFSGPYIELRFIFLYNLPLNTQ